MNAKGYALLCLVLPSFTFSAGVSSAVLDKANQIQREQQLDQQQQLKKDLDKLNKKSLQPQSQNVNEPNTKEGVKRYINDIQISGITLLSQSTVDDITSKYAKKELSIGEIQTLMGELTMAYMGSGYTTTRVYIPAQDLTTGTLKLNVLEGTIEKIQTDANSNVSVPNLFPYMEGEVLNIYDIEQGLEQLNRLGSNKAKMEIQPSTKDGQSIVIIKNEHTNPFAFEANTDNTGSKTTGRYQHGFSITFDNPTNTNDMLSISSKRSLYSYKDKNSFSRSATYSIPFGYTTVSLNLSRTSFETPLITDSGNILTDGNSASETIIVDRVLSRGQNYKTSASISLSKKRTEFNILGERVAVASPKLTVVDADLKGFVMAHGNMYNWQVGASRGVKMLGANQDDADIDQSSAHAQFVKLKYSLGVSRSFDLDGSSISISSQFSGATSQDKLYSGEQFTLTGQSGVRGFYEETIAGENGWNVRNDLKWTIPNIIYGASISPYIGYDFGELKSFNGSQASSVGGEAIGISLNQKHLNTSFEYAKQLWKPSTIEDENGIYSFRMSMLF